MLQVNAAPFAECDQQSVLRGLDFNLGNTALDGSFTENSSLGCKFAVFIEMFQGEQQGQIRIASKGGGIHPVGDIPMPTDKPVIRLVESSLARCQITVVLRFNLNSQTSTHGIPHLNQSPYALHPLR